MAFHDKAIRLYSDALKSLITKDFPIDIVQEINNIPQRNVLENNFIEYKTKYTLKRRSFSESSISIVTSSDLKQNDRFIQSSSSNSSIQIKIPNNIQLHEQHFTSSEEEKYKKKYRTTVIRAPIKSYCSKETKL